MTHKEQKNKMKAQLKKDRRIINKILGLCQEYDCSLNEVFIKIKKIRINE